MSNQQTIYSGDQNGIGWDAPIKLRIMARLGYNVKHAIHTADQFSRPPDNSPNYLAVTHEKYRADGNVNRWTASLEAPLFLGRMPLHPSDFSSQGIDFSKIARFKGCSLDEVVQQFTSSDWLGLSIKSNSRVAHGITVKEILSHFPKLRKPLRRNLEDSVRPNHKKLATTCFDKLFAFTEHPTKTWPEAAKTIMQKSLSAAGCNEHIEVTTSVDTFACTKTTVASPFMALFLDHYHTAMAAYNEAIEGPGETIKSLEYGELPFFAIVDTNNTLVRISLTYQTNDTIRSVLARASEHGILIAVLGKAITHVVELLMLAPIVICQEGSGYIPKAAKFARLFEQRTGTHLHLHKFHRLQLNALDALTNVTSEFKLPAYLHQSFGTEWITGIEFADKWRSVVTKAESETKQFSGCGQDTQLSALQNFNLLSDQTLSLLLSIQSQRNAYELEIRNLFQQIQQKGLVDEEKKKAINNAKQQKTNLHQRHNLALLAHTEQALLDGIEHERAKAIQSRIVIARSLKYWNCRPFTHWVDAIPGWYESIQQHSRMTLDPFFSN